MGEVRRTFLLGAGFSKAVADGPLMNELWSYIEKAFRFEKNRGDISIEDNLRIKWFKDLDDFIKKLEKQSTIRYKNLNGYQIKVDIRENLEYLVSLLDLHVVGSHRPGPKIHFKKEGSHIDPSPAIPLVFTSKQELEGIRNILQTYFYLVFFKLSGNALADNFAEFVSLGDQVVTFNYDLVLEESLSKIGKWSHLNGYVGVYEFEDLKYKEKLEKLKMHSKLRIHKLHGSINWKTNQLLRLTIKDKTKIITEAIERNYVGRHIPDWILPSFIKPFEREEFYEIWRSAIRVISGTEELVIIGYRFRPEDSNSFLLISMLPTNSKIILVDPEPADKIKRLESMGLKVHKTFERLEEYLDNQ